MKNTESKFPHLVKEDWNAGIRDPLLFLAQGLGSGCIAPMRGSWGTLGGVAFYLLIAEYITNYSYWMVFVVLATIVGIPLCTYAENKLASKDPHCVVWDEWCGIWFAYSLLPLMPVSSMPNYAWLIIGFVIFRWLDITKPGLIGKMENLSKGAGIMLDDIVAGIATAAILYMLGLVAAIII